MILNGMFSICTRRCMRFYNARIYDVGVIKKIRILYHARVYNIFLEVVMWDSIDVGFPTVVLQSSIASCAL